MINFRLTLLKLAVFFVVSGVLGAVVVATLDGPDVGTDDTYHAIFADVSGLHAGDPVRVSGVVVGSVESLDFIDATHVDVTFTANRNQTLTTSSYAVVRFANLLGQRFLALTQSGAPGAALRHGATIPVSHTAPALSLTALFNGFRPLFRALDADQINKFSTEIIKILQGESGTIEDLLAQTAQLTGNLADRDQLFVGVVDNLGALLRSVASHDNQLGQLVDSFASLTHNLATDTPNIGRSIDAIDGLTASVDSLLGGLNAHDLHGTVIDLQKLTSIVASNSGVLDRTIKAFPVAFSDFNRVTQSGNWISAYPCSIGFSVPSSPVLTLEQVSAAIAGFLGIPGAGGIQTVLNLLGGVLGTNTGIPIPLNIPQGVVAASPSKNSAVCR